MTRFDGIVATCAVFGTLSLSSEFWSVPMGATAQFNSISLAVLDALRARPKLVEPFVCAFPPSFPPGTPEHIASAVRANSELQAMLVESRADLRSAAPELAELLLAAVDEARFSLDKAWDPLNQILVSAGATPQSALGRCILGGQEFGRDLGYGRARFLTPAETAETAEAVRALEASAFHAFARQIGVPENAVEYLWTLYASMSAYYAAARSGGRAMLLHLA